MQTSVFRPLKTAVCIQTAAVGVATGAMAWMVRRQRSAVLLTGAALALANYFARVEPVNVRFRALSPARCPATSWRCAPSGSTATHWISGCFAAAFVLVASALLVRPALRVAESH